MRSSCRFVVYVWRGATTDSLAATSFARVKEYRVGYQSSLCYCDYLFARKSLTGTQTAIKSNQTRSIWSWATIQSREIQFWFIWILGIANELRIRDLDSARLFFGRAVTLYAGKVYSEKFRKRNHRSDDKKKRNKTFSIGQWKMRLWKIKKIFLGNHIRQFLVVHILLRYNLQLFYNYLDFRFLKLLEPHIFLKNIILICIYTFFMNFMFSFYYSVILEPNILMKFFKFNWYTITRIFDFRFKFIWNTNCTTNSGFILN